MGELEIEELFMRYDLYVMKVETKNRDNKGRKKARKLFKEMYEKYWTKIGTWDEVRDIIGTSDNIVNNSEELENVRNIIKSNTSRFYKGLQVVYYPKLQFLFTYKTNWERTEEAGTKFEMMCTTCADLSTFTGFNFKKY